MAVIMGAVPEGAGRSLHSSMERSARPDVKEGSRSMRSRLERREPGRSVGESLQQPTLSDMTMYEMNFSLLVEDMLQNIAQPEYRQIIVELLMIVSVILERNPEFEFQEKVDLDKLVKEAFNDFQRDQSRLQGAEKQDDMSAFYNTPPLGKRGTCSYLTKAVMSVLLEAEVKPSNEDPCSIS